VRPAIVRASARPEWGTFTGEALVIIGRPRPVQAAAAIVCLIVLGAVGVRADCPGSFPCASIGDCAPGNQCTTGDCVAGCCVFGVRDCNDGVVCTDDSCDNLHGCVHTPHCPDDGLVCNGAPGCIALPLGFGVVVPFCLPAVPLNCDDGSACTIDSCVEPSGCQHVLVNCDDGNPCTTDGCDPASGCTHTPIPGCCATAADCLVDKCHARVCQALRCSGDPLPLSCDDGDPSTIDGCDPAVGCTHVPRGSTTTSTTLVGAGACRVDGDCPAPDDPCSAAACTAGVCGGRPVGGFDALACICRRTDPAACAAAAIPRRVTRRRGRACAFIAKAAKGGKHAQRLVGRAARFLSQAETALAAAKHVSPACVQALGAQLADGVQRAERAGAKKGIGP